MTKSQWVFGINFKSAELDRVAEVHWKTPELLSGFLKELKDAIGLQEVFFLETCNRRELYFRTQSERDPEALSNHLLKHLSSACSIHFDRNHFFIKQGEAAMLHLLRVASGLESMVLGETEIIKQIKVQFQRARQAGNAGPFLGLWVDEALRTSKSIRSKTHISKNAVTLASLAHRYVTQKKCEKIVFVGAGQFMKSILPYFLKHTHLDMLFVNRTLPTDLAEEYEGQAMSLQDFLADPPHFDALVSATGSPDVLIQKKWIHKHSLCPKVLIDLALPLDIDPTIANSETDLFNLEDMERVLKQNRQERESELPKTEPIFSDHLETLKQKIFEQSLAGFNQEMSSYFADTSAKVLRHFLAQKSQMINDDEIKNLTEDLVKRLVSVPVLGLKGVAKDLGQAGVEAYTGAIRSSSKLFRDAS